MDDFFQIFSADLVSKFKSYLGFDYHLFVIPDPENEKNPDVYFTRYLIVETFYLMSETYVVWLKSTIFSLLQV